MEMGSLCAQCLVMSTLPLVQCSAGYGMLSVAVGTSVSIATLSNFLPIGTRLEVERVIHHVGELLDSDVLPPYARYGNWF